MKSSSSSKSKYKATSGSINNKILVKLSDRFKRNCLNEIDDIFPQFVSEGKKDKRFKQIEFTVVMERIYGENVEIKDTEDENIEVEIKDIDVENNDVEIKDTEDENIEVEIKDTEDEIKNTDDIIIEDDDELKDEIKEIVKEKINEKDKLPKFSPKDTPDDLTQAHEWKIPDDCNQLCKYLIKYCKDNYKVPPQSIFKIFIGKYMRLASTKISPPDSSTLNRVIFNLNNNDVYRLEPGQINVKSVIKGLSKDNNEDDNDKEEKDEVELKIPGLDLNKKLEHRTVYLEEGRCFPMGPFRQSNYEIILNSGSEIRIPPKIQGKMKIRGQKTLYKIKPKHYNRVTMIIDTCVSSDMIDKITKETMKQVSKNKDMLDDVKNKLNNSDLNINELMQGMSGSGTTSNNKKRRNRKRKNKNNDVVDTDLEDMMK